MRVAAFVVSAVLAASGTLLHSVASAQTPTVTKPVTLTWIAPTQNEDGTPLEADDLTYYRAVFWREDKPNQMRYEFTTDNTGQESWVLPDFNYMVGKRYIFTLHAGDANGNESVASNEAAVFIEEGEIEPPVEPPVDPPPVSPATLSLQIPCERIEQAEDGSITCVVILGTQ